MAPLIAIVGSDGSGKSTVGTALLAWMNERQATELHHLGKQTGNIGRAIARWPLIGGKLDKAIVKKSGGAKKGGGPTAFTAIIIYAFSMRRVRRFRKMLAARQRGIAILADRFPQTAVPGPMDGLGLAKAGAGLPGRLARRERAQYEWMEQYRPDLVLRLNVDLPTALARKPDHRPSSLATKIADVPRLTFNGARIVDLDSTQPLDLVIEQAKAAISETLGW
ncbi:nucleoside triphosphate hydrolase [Sphingomonas qilianensis]|uniref:Nucleoside triphosphate hydrolase n=1 Tax=Sphingomonas qilianensis TaxID=1736690 RepID=A0ABU9XUJ7_9SPHN